MIPAQAIADARTAQRQTGASALATALALAVAGPESGYNPRAIGDGGTSFGYLQMHQGGGLGDGHAVRDLLDGVYNFAAGMRYLQGRLDAGAGPWEALAPWSARPAGMANLGEALSALGAAISPEIALGLSGHEPGPDYLRLALLAVGGLLLLDALGG